MNNTDIRNKERRLQAHAKRTLTRADLVERTSAALVLVEQTKARLQQIEHAAARMAYREASLLAHLREIATQAEQEVQQTSRWRSGRRNRARARAALANELVTWITQAPSREAEAAREEGRRQIALRQQQQREQIP